MKSSGKERKKMAKEDPVKIEKDLRKFVENLRTTRENAMKQLATSEQRIRDVEEALSSRDFSTDNATSNNNTVSGEDVVEYTYKPGDTFGQVILDLGLNTDKGLWGADGDVAFYNEQLKNQGIWPDGQLGNIPIGTTIKLQRRGTEGNTTADGGTIIDAEEKLKDELRREQIKAEESKDKAKKDFEEAVKKEDEANRLYKDAKLQKKYEDKKKAQLLMTAIREALKRKK